MRRTPLSFLVMLLSTVGGAAQPSVPVGVAWTVPEDSATAVRDLAAMRERGVRAVRTDLVTHDAVFDAADRLGVALYQDLPVDNLPAARLLDTLAFAERTLAAALAQSQGHPSARHFGLTVGSDTSDPAACVYLERLQQRVARDGPPDAMTYYVSRFIEGDRCAATVDAVLLDVLDGDPAVALARWRDAHETPAGLGAVGWAVRPTGRDGHAVPGSPRAQARALESGLRAALALDPWALFVYRWRDTEREGAVLATDAVVAEYGLYDAAGTPRPALEVVAGLYTGQQTLFAFDAGYSPQGRRPTLLVMGGWLLVLAVALLYSATPTFRVLASEHLPRPTMYQDAVRRARGIEGWPTAALAGVLALSFGVAWAIALRTLGHTDVLALLATGLPEHILEGLNLLLRQSLLLVVLLASLYALGLLVNVIAIVLLARTNRLLPAQALTLAVWARWPMLLLLVAAMALASQPPGADVAVWAIALLGTWLVLELLTQIRMLYDLAGVARVPLGRTLAVGFGVPFALTLTVLAVLAAAARPELLFVWHLVTRT